MDNALIMTRLIRFTLISFLAIAQICCAPRSSNVYTQSGHSVYLDGWVKIKGEVMLYENRAAMLARDHSRCISGVYYRQKPGKLMQFDGKHVRVFGERYTYATLPNEQTDILPRKVLGASVIPNFCMKDDVILIGNISIIR
jgi:hypothetical protein